MISKAIKEKIVTLYGTELPCLTKNDYYTNFGKLIKCKPKWLALSLSFVNMMMVKGISP